MQEENMQQKKKEKKSDFYNQWLLKHAFKGEKRKYIINIDVLVSEGLRVKIWWLMNEAAAEYEIREEISESMRGRRDREMRKENRVQ